MYILRNLSIYPLSFLIWTVLLSPGRVSAITLTELRQIISETQIDAPTTAHIVYTEEINNNGNQPFSIDQNDIRYKPRMINKRRLTKVDAIMDSVTESVRSTITDLRDIDKLLKDNNIPLEQKGNVSATKTLLYKGCYVGGLLPGDHFSPTRCPTFMLSEAPNPAHYMFNNLSLGVIDKKVLTNDWNPTITEVNKEKKSLLYINITPKGQKALNGTIECDPSLGYRFRRIRWYQNDKLVKETIANDYREINGVPYPFLYIYRSFDENGGILRERKQVVQDIKLCIDLSEENFTVFMPKGTIINDLILSHKATEVEQDSYMGIADILRIHAQEIAQAELTKLIIQPDSLPSGAILNEIFIPHIIVAQKENKPFIIDLASTKLIQVPVGDKLDTEDVYNYLIKLDKGDIAWNGSLITLRDAKALSIGEESENTFKYVANQWSGSCKLPQKLELPYTLLITSKDDVNYLITIEKIETDGIYITLKELEPDELKRYRPVEDKEKTM